MAVVLYISASISLYLFSICFQRIFRIYWTTYVNKQHILKEQWPINFSNSEFKMHYILYTSYVYKNVKIEVQNLLPVTLLL